MSFIRGDEPVISARKPYACKTTHLFGIGNGQYASWDRIGFSALILGNMVL